MNEQDFIEKNIEYYYSILEEWEKKYVISSTPNERALASIEIKKIRSSLEKLTIQLEKEKMKKDYIVNVPPFFITSFFYVLLIDIFFGVLTLDYLGFILILITLAIIIIQYFYSNISYLYKASQIILIFNILIICYFIIFYPNSLILVQNNLDDNIFDGDKKSETPIIASLDSFALIFSIPLIIFHLLLLLKNDKR